MTCFARYIALSPWNTNSYLFVPCVVFTYGILITFVLCYEFISRVDEGMAPQDFIFSLLLFWKKNGLSHFCEALTALAVLWGGVQFLTAEGISTFFCCLPLILSCTPVLPLAAPHKALWHWTPGCMISEKLIYAQTPSSANLFQRVSLCTILHVRAPSLAVAKTAGSKII